MFRGYIIKVPSHFIFSDALDPELPFFYLLPYIPVSYH